ncbi:MAG: DUF4214 domain-containing protein, partial [Acidimicrobiia bacterium]
MSNEQLVEDAYQALLGRSPDEDGRRYWTDRLAGDLTHQEFLADLARTAEHRRHLVTAAFRSFLDRAPDPGALDWYTGLLTRSTTAVTVRADILGSQEYFGRAGGSAEAWLDAVYRDLLGRQPDQAGRDHFLGQLRSGVPREPIASAILVSPEASAGTPLGIQTITPQRQALVTSLDAIEIDLDHPVVPSAATVIVTAGGQRVAGTVSQGDFDDILVFSLAEGAPDPVAPGERAALAVTVVAHDGQQVGRADAGFYYQRPAASLSRGDSGPAVTELQNDLAQLGYWIGPIDGVYGQLTQQAVYAFQKAEGLERTGSADPSVRQAIASAGRVQPRSTSGTWWEVDKARQLLIYAVDGRAVWVWNTSTGTEEPYTYEGRQLVADTPPGRWDVYRQVDGVRDGALGRLYRPKYFHTDGIAVHGYPSVPPYRASHGCVRVTNAAMDWIW